MSSQSLPTVSAQVNPAENAPAYTIQRDDDGWTGSNYDRGLRVKEIAAIFRKHAKSAYPGCVFSVTTKGYSSININLMQAPFCPWVSLEIEENRLEYERRQAQNEYYTHDEAISRGNRQLNANCIEREFILSPEAKAVLADVAAFMKSYNRDHSDMMTDYFDCNFYLHMEIGKWNKPFIRTAESPEVAAAEAVEEIAAENLAAVRNAEYEDEVMQAENSLDAYWAGSAAASVMRDYSAGRVTVSAPAESEPEQIESSPNAYEAKQEARRQRYLDRAAGARAESRARHDQARAMAEIIPFGQPILVGHHSERRDRNYRARIENTFGKSFKAMEKAEHYENKAASVGMGGISSDDPAAVKKLRGKLAKLEEGQETMKSANAAIRRGKTEAEKIAGLAALGFPEQQAQKLIMPDFCGRVGFPDYALQNNNANIHRIRERIAGLEKLAAREATEEKTDLYEYREDQEENRLMFIFDGKPEESIRAILKRNGFKWSPRRGAWVRQITTNALYAAKHIKERLASLETA